VWGWLIGIGAAIAGAVALSSLAPRTRVSAVVPEGDDPLRLLAMVHRCMMDLRLRPDVNFTGVPRVGRSAANNLPIATADATRLLTSEEFMRINDCSHRLRIRGELRGDVSFGPTSSPVVGPRVSRTTLRGLRGHRRRRRIGVW
jgi:hypothetical protein